MSQDLDSSLDANLRTMTISGLLLDLSAATFHRDTHFEGEGK